MPLEFVGTCKDMEILESLCINLMKCGVATKVKDSSFYDKQDDGLNVGEKHIQNKFSTKVFDNYLLKVTNKNSLMPFTVKVRFWKDQRINRAGVKLSEEGLRVILQSISVVSLLQQMNANLGSSGDIKLTRVAEVLTQALNKNGTKIEPISVSRVD
jgi:hypothetical protein